jgi:DNA-binding MarR family transcriptional regulator
MPDQHSDPAAAELAVALLGRLFRLSPRLVELMDFSAREYGLGFARGRVLWALHESGPVLMRAISQTLGVSPRTVTSLVDSLEADGWVTRSPHPTDRRATIIGLTPIAEETLVRLTDGYRAFAHRLLADQPAPDLERFLAVLGQLEARLDDAVASELAEFEAAPPRLPKPRTR